MKTMIEKSSVRGKFQQFSSIIFGRVNMTGYDIKATRFRCDSPASTDAESPSPSLHYITLHLLSHQYSLVYYAGEGRYAGLTGIKLMLLYASEGWTGAV